MSENEEPKRLKSVTEILEAAEKRTDEAALRLVRMKWTLAIVVAVGVLIIWLAVN